MVSKLQKLSVDRPYVMYAAYDLTIHGSQNPLSHSSPLEGNNALPRNLRPYYVRDFLEHKSLKSTEVHINVEDTLFQAGPNDKYYQGIEGSRGNSSLSRRQLSKKQPSKVT